MLQRHSFVDSVGHSGGKGTRYTGDNYILVRVIYNTKEPVIAARGCWRSSESTKTILNSTIKPQAVLFTSSRGVLCR